MKIFFMRKLFFSYEYKRLQSLTLDIQIHIEAVSWCKNYDAFHQMIFHCKREKKTHNKIDDKMECEWIEMPCIHLCQNSYDNMIHSISYKTFFFCFSAQVYQIYLYNIIRIHWATTECADFSVVPNTLFFLASFSLTLFIALLSQHHKIKCIYLWKKNKISNQDWRRHMFVIHMSWKVYFICVIFQLLLELFEMSSLFDG